MRRFRMKTLLSIALILIATMVSAQTWYPSDSINVGWDAVSVSSGVVSYKVYTMPHPSGTATNVATVTGTTASVTFATEGKYYIGVSTVRTVDEEALESIISWSNVAADCLNGVTFGAKYYTPPGKPTGLVKQ
jgi:hypothetical protein